MARSLTLAVLALTAALLALPAVAAAKGPSAARIEGPGLASPLVLTGFGEDGTGPLGALTIEGGFFATTFGQVPDARLPGRPAGDLGPRYSVDYTVPAGESEPGHVAQDLYPYAAGGPVLYLAPGQRMFAGGETVGGWIRGSETLRAALVTAGLPASAPGVGSSPRLDEPLLVGGGLVALLALAGVLAVVARRRGRQQAGSDARREATSA
ncbi:hypothetical protein Gocc_2771 [Gaiella occulta]|uniref:Uncharacterized protein n=1 Tax=Gaiella occulta TaxID=1002870 RepID=A0A7M2YTR2_9ACTN|nr:hypothetical protein [Gaiella occulta]RDI73415.1 hypothetical protein Gocc_2771 [Gaiella occulta]